MSSYAFDCVIEVNNEYEEVTIIKGSLKTGCNKVWSSILEFEVDQVGLTWLFNLNEEPLPDGRWRVKGSIHYWQDYYGDWDSECNIALIEPANRRARRGLKYGKSQRDRRLEGTS